MKGGLPPAENFEAGTIKNLQRPCAVTYAVVVAREMLPLQGTNNSKLAY